VPRIQVVFSELCVRHKHHSKEVIDTTTAQVFQREYTGRGTAERETEPAAFAAAIANALKKLELEERWCSPDCKVQA